VIEANRILTRNETRTYPPMSPIRWLLRMSPMLEINTDPLVPPVIPLFSKSESNNNNRLILISFGSCARARALISSAASGCYSDSFRYYGDSLLSRAAGDR